MSRPALTLLLSLVFVACGDKEDEGGIDFTGDDDADEDGYTPADGDCDDDDAAVNPDADELCDGVDNDCNGAIDDDATDISTWYADADGDGYGAEEYPVEACEQPSGYVAETGDCHDLSEDWYPGAPEEDCDDPNDYNCDGSVGETDADGDGYTACTECDDSDADINPGEDEVCDDLDNDCSGEADDDPVDGETYFPDDDADSFGSDEEGAALVACEQPSDHVTNDFDCDDSNSFIHPDAAEVCDYVDNNCDGFIDPVDSEDALVWNADADGDGAGSATDTTTSCTQPSGYLSDDTDCDDDDPSARPGLTEV